MESQKSPWIAVPDDWLGDEYSHHSGYRAFQEYFGLIVKPEVIREYMLGEGVYPAAKIEVESFSADEEPGKLRIRGEMNVTGAFKLGGTGTDVIEIRRTFSTIEKTCRFDLMGAGRVNIAGFGAEYYRRVIPFLRKLGIERITTMPTTGPEWTPERNRLVGAYVWSFYGYSNDNISETLDQYIDWLKNVKKIRLGLTTEDDIRAIKRMLKLARDKQPDGEETGKEFLLGLDAQNKPTRVVGWNGTHHNINEESPQNEEMREMIEYLRMKIT